MECEAPVDTDHGTWSYTRLRNGDTAQLQCETGYRLDDEDKILTCNINGEWINAPTCVGRCLQADLHDQHERASVSLFVVILYSSSQIWFSHN